jgi:hypothetical protein
VTNFRWIQVLIVGALGLWCDALVAAVRPVTSIDVDRITAVSDVRDVSPVFVSDELVALLVRSGQVRTGSSRVLLLRLRGSNLELLGESSKVNEGDEIFAVSGDRVLLSAPRHKYVYSTDLAKRWEIPFRFLPSFFPRSGIIGETSEAQWSVFTLNPALTVVRRGAGSLVSVSEQVIAYRQGDSIHSERPGGELIGSLPSAIARETRTVEIAGTDRLYLDAVGRERIVDFKGKELIQLHPLVPDGWGFRHGWSADGQRMLFDHFTRTVPFSKIIPDFLSRLLGAPEDSNGELVRVLDVRRGGTCFSLDSPGTLYGVTGGYHADISPSGKWVAVSDLKHVSLYQLPEACGK